MDQDYDNLAIPKPLNEPIKMAKWTLSEINLFVSCTIILWFVGSILVGLCAGVFSVFLYGWLSKFDGGDLTKKGRYWFFPYKKSKYQIIIPSHIKELVG
jgi:hypothetical protein